MADAVDQVEDLFERIEGALDRIEKRRPGLDAESMRLLERAVADGIELTRSIPNASPATNELYAAGLLALHRKHRQWMELLRSLHGIAAGSTRWWTRVDDLGSRIRGHFQEFECDVLDRVGNRLSRRDRTC